MLKKAHERRRRSIVKSIAYRTLSITVDSIVAYYFVKDAATTILIVLFVNGYSTFLYYFHERIWARITWGNRV